MSIIQHYKCLKEITNCELYKLIFILNILVSFLYNIINSKNINSFEDSLLSFFTGNIGIIFTMVIMILATINVINWYDKNTELLIRFKNKKIYLKNLIIMVSLANVMTLLFVLFVVMAISIFFNPITFEVYDMYNIKSLLYLLFLIFKVYSMFNTFLLIFTCLYKKFDLVVSVIYYVIIILLTSFGKVSISVTGISNFKILPNYYLSSVSFGSFGTEILYFFYFLILNFIIFTIIYKLCNNLKKDIIR